MELRKGTKNLKYTILSLVAFVVKKNGMLSKGQVCLLYDITLSHLDQELKVNFKYFCQNFWVNINFTTHQFSIANFQVLNLCCNFWEIFSHTPRSTSQFGVKIYFLLFLFFICIFSFSYHSIKLQFLWQQTNLSWDSVGRAFLIYVGKTEEKNAIFGCQNLAHYGMGGDQNWKCF